MGFVDSAAASVGGAVGSAGASAPSGSLVGGGGGAPTNVTSGTAAGPQPPTAAQPSPQGGNVTVVAPGTSVNTTGAWVAPNVRLTYGTVRCGWKHHVHPCMTDCNLSWVGPPSAADVSGLCACVKAVVLSLSGRLSHRLRPALSLVPRSRRRQCRSPRHRGHTTGGPGARLLRLWGSLLRWHGW